MVKEGLKEIEEDLHRLWLTFAIVSTLTLLSLIFMFIYFYKNLIFGC